MKIFISNEYLIVICPENSFAKMIKMTRITLLYFNFNNTLIF